MSCLIKYQAHFPSHFQEELDSIDEDEGDREKRIKKLSLDVELRSAVRRERAAARWTLLDVHFGVPLFDAELNGLVCRKIVDHGLCKNDR